MGLKAAHGWAKLELKVFLDTSEALKVKFALCSLAEGQTQPPVSQGWGEGRRQCRFFTSSSLNSRSSGCDHPFLCALGSGAGTTSRCLSGTINLLYGLGCHARKTNSTGVLAKD